LINGIYEDIWVVAVWNDHNYNGIHFFERFKKGKVRFLCTLFELVFKYFLSIFINSYNCQNLCVLDLKNVKEITYQFSDYHLSFSSSSFCLVCSFMCTSVLLPACQNQCLAWPCFLSFRTPCTTRAGHRLESLRWSRHWWSSSAFNSCIFCLFMRSSFFRRGISSLLLLMIKALIG
jgi:hypothetical protein